MDKKEFVHDIDDKLRRVESFVEAQTFVSPSTLEKSLQQERARPIISELHARLAEARSRLDELRAMTDPEWGSLRADLEAHWAEIGSLMRKLRE